MNNTNQKLPEEVVFLLEEKNRAFWQSEIDEAHTEWENDGPALKLCTVSSHIQNDEESPVIPEVFFASDASLVLTDSVRLYRAAADKGCFAVGYVHAGNTDQKFPGADYLVAEPQYVDADSWQKIYERLAGLPWTILTTKRCILREFTEEDIDAMYRIYDDPDAARFLTPLSEDKNKEKELLSAYISKIYRLYGYGYWAVVLKETEDVIGRVGFSPFAMEGEDASLGYVIRSDCRKSGLASEVCSAVIQYASQMLGFEVIGADTHSDNKASEALLRKLGFSKVWEEDGKVGYRIRF